VIFQLFERGRYLYWTDIESEGDIPIEQIIIEESDHDGIEELIPKNLTIDFQRGRRSKPLWRILPPT